MLLHIFLACQWPQHRHCKDGCDSKWRTLAIWSSGVRGKKLNNSKTSWHTSQTALNWPLLMSCFSDSPQSFSLQLDRKTVQGNMRFVFSSPSRYTIPLQRFMWFFFFFFFHMLLLMRRVGPFAGRSWGRWFPFLPEEGGHQSCGGWGRREEAQEEEEVRALNTSSANLHSRELWKEN